ncbi:MAG: hypothetical protein K2I77_05950 [Anaeroplasmataceae bacterium]|nr:hypothetical protein [Anaeroplasmataceae bacterium]
MKLVILRPRLKLFFWAPTSILRWNWIWKKILSSKENIEFEEIAKLLPFLLKSLRQYVKKNGHFYLLEVEAKDGTKVKIKV